MHKIFSLFAVPTILLVGVLSASCSSDDEYKSTPPRFSDVTFMPEEIHPGDRVTATAVQYRKGHLLDRTSYSWSISGTSEDLEVSNNKTVLYDNDKSNPTCIFTAPSTPGEYTLILDAKYNVSGQSGTSASSAQIPDGSVEYSSSPFNCFVVLRKDFKVVNP